MAMSRKGTEWQPKFATRRSAIAIVDATCIDEPTFLIYLKSSNEQQELPYREGRENEAVYRMQFTGFGNIADGGSGARSGFIGSR